MGGLSSGITADRGAWGKTSGALPALLGLVEPETAGAPCEPQPCRGMGSLGRAHTWEGTAGDLVSSPGWVTGAQAGTHVHGSDKRCCWGNAVSLAALRGLVPSYSRSVCSHRIGDIGGDAPVSGL